ncbi:MAG: hypothetical protein SVV67_07820 [Bacillota bacterium]|nr:hypothetical protein [Bacillota bacterium]
MELVERYIYAVTRRLPEKQRSDIERELRSLIEDMLADRTGGDEASETDIEEVLMELGDPAEMADQYRMKKHFLIGPENFALYMLVIKIVLAAVVFGITLALAIGYVVEPPSSIWALVGGYLGSIFNAVLNAFAWVTLIFAIFEYYDVNMAKEVNKKEEKKQWNPADLPMLPLEDVSIKPAESIVGLVFAILAFILLNTAEHLIGIYIFSEEAATQIIPLFDHETFRSLLPLLNIMLAAGAIKELLKLIIGKWTIKMAVANLVLNLLSLVLFVLFIFNPNLWNAQFFSFIIELDILPAGTEFSVIWTGFLKGLTAVVAFVLVIDSIINLVKGIKYRLAE